MFHDLEITDLNKTVALFMEPHVGALSQDFHSRKFIHGAKLINTAKSMLTDSLSEDESMTITESSNGMVKIEAVLKSSVYSQYMTDPWSMCWSSNNDSSRMMSICGEDPTMRFECNEELDPIYQDPFARMLLYRIVVTTVHTHTVSPVTSYRSSNIPPMILVLKEIYDTTRANVTEWLSRRDVTLPDGTTPTWLQLAYRMTHIGSFDMLTHIFFQQYPIDCTKFYPSPTVANAIVLDSRLYEATADDAMLFNATSVSCQAINQKCCRFMNADGYWILADPDTMTRMIFGADFSGLPLEKPIREPNERMLKCVQHLQQHLVDAVLEYNKTCENESDRILQTKVLDQYGCMMHSLDAFIIHYRSMYNLNTPEHEFTYIRNEPLCQNTIDKDAVNRIAKAYKDLL